MFLREVDEEDGEEVDGAVGGEVEEGRDADADEDEFGESAAYHL